jgi:hypothetical protein
VDGDLRWADLYLRRDEIDLGAAMLASARERALRASSERMLARVDARAADFWVRLGELDQARELLDEAERNLHGDGTLSSDHLTLLCLQLGDQTGAQAMLAEAYAAALETRDLPLLSLLAVNAAAVADSHGLHRKSAVLLGAASRLRGAHDRTDRQVHDLTDRAKAALGQDAFTAAYERGWELEARAAVTEVDPGSLRGIRPEGLAASLPGPDDLSKGNQ